MAAAAPAFLDLDTAAHILFKIFFRVARSYSGPLSYRHLSRRLATFINTAPNGTRTASYKDADTKKQTEGVYLRTYLLPLVGGTRNDPATGAAVPPEGEPTPTILSQLFTGMDDAARWAYFEGEYPAGGGALSALLSMQPASDLCVEFSNTNKDFLFITLLDLSQADPIDQRLYHISISKTPFDVMNRALKRQHLTVTSSIHLTDDSQPKGPNRNYYFAYPCLSPLDEPGNAKAEALASRIGLSYLLAEGPAPVSTWSAKIPPQAPTLTPVAPGAGAGTGAGAGAGPGGIPGGKRYKTYRRRVTRNRTRRLRTRSRRH